MSVYRTEEEQLESIRNWWNKYSTIITLIVAVILLVFSGHKYFKWRQEQQLAEASNAYEQMMLAFANQNSKGVKSYANQLINDYSKTRYADIAKMTKAKLLINQNQYDTAKQLLEEVATNSKMMALRQVAKIRIARLLTNEKGYDAALQQLSSVNDPTYLPLINELKGDIFAATGHYQKAISAYKKAISAVRNHGMGNVFLEMKTQEIAALSQVNVANTKAEKV